MLSRVFNIISLFIGLLPKGVNDINVFIAAALKAVIRLRGDGR